MPRSALSLLLVTVISAIAPACAAPDPASPSPGRDRARAPVQEVAAPTGAQVAEAQQQAKDLQITDQQYSAFEQSAEEEYAAAAPPEEIGVPFAGRAVVVVNDSTTGSGNPASFRRIDAGMKLLFDLGLRGSYGKVYYLGEGEATSQAFFDAVGKAAHDPSVAVVDALVNLHGGPGELVFNDRPLTTDEIAAGLVRAVPDDLFYKLRVVYNQACFGETQAAGFVKGGFFAASGTRGVHATGFVDWPAFVRTWRSGGTFAAALRPQSTTGAIVRTIADWFTARGSDDVDNTWTLTGEGDVAVHTRLVP